MTSANVAEQPVQNIKTLDTPTGKVGYMTFNDHLFQAEQVRLVVHELSPLRPLGELELARARNELGEIPGVCGPHDAYVLFRKPAGRLLGCRWRWRGRDRRIGRRNRLWTK